MLDEEDGLAGGRELDVVRAGHLLAQRPQGSRRPPGLIGEDHVAELEGVQQLVVAQAALVAPRQARPMGSRGGWAGGVAGVRRRRAGTRALVDRKSVG